MMAKDKSEGTAQDKQHDKNKRSNKSQSQSGDNPEARQEFIDRRNMENSIFPREDLSE
jgi:hypothetical protein